MSKEKRITVRLNELYSNFLENHPVFKGKTLTEAVTFCIEKVRQSMLARHAFLSSPPTSDQDRILYNLYQLFILLDFADRQAIANCTKNDDLDAFYSIFGFRFELPSEYD